MTVGESGTRKPLEVLVPFLGLLYTVLIFVAVIIQFATQPGGLPSFIFILFPFLALFVGAAFGVWKRSRIGYIVSIAVSVIFILFEGAFAVEALSNPSAFITFFESVTILSVLIITVVYSILGLRSVWRKGAFPGIPRTMARSSVIVLFGVGFILGGLVIGALAGATEARLLANSGTSADVLIVQGAGNQGNGQFFVPANFTVKVGQSVTWANKDGATHTVTNSPGTLFDQTLASGDTFKFTFTQPGTYRYHCTPHPWMKGTIVVNSG